MERGSSAAATHVLGRLFCVVVVFRGENIESSRGLENGPIRFQVEADESNSQAMTMAPASSREGRQKATICSIIPC